MWQWRSDLLSSQHYTAYKAASCCVTLQVLLEISSNHVTESSRYVTKLTTFGLTRLFYGNNILCTKLHNKDRQHLTHKKKQNFSPGAIFLLHFYLSLMTIAIPAPGHNSMCSPNDMYLHAIP